jgi:phosphoribosylglycinamide formyltransferase-1
MTAGSSSRPRCFGILISGRGSNMEALVRAARAGRIPATPSVVISNEADAKGLATAASFGVPTAVFDHRDSPTREEHDRRVLDRLREHEVELVCLAGYMRLLSPLFVSAYPGRIMNIHPSLLPAFPGLHAQRKAVRYGVKVSGCTVHFVDEELDHGPIILQTAVEVREGDSEESLSTRILQHEHRLYAEAVRLFFEDRLQIDGRRVNIRPPGQE